MATSCYWQSCNSFQHNLIIRYEDCFFRHTAAFFSLLNMKRNLKTLGYLFHLFDEHFINRANKFYLNYEWILIRSLDLMKIIMDIILPKVKRLQRKWKIISESHTDIERKEMTSDELKHQLKCIIRNGSNAVPLLLIYLSAVVRITLHLLIIRLFFFYHRHRDRSYLWPAWPLFRLAKRPSNILRQKKHGYFMSDVDMETGATIKKTRSISDYVCKVFMNLNCDRFYQIKFGQI